MLQDGEAKIRLNGAIHKMSYKDCNECGRRHPPDAKRCHPCGNRELQDARCTRDSRVSDYFASLRQAGLWPSVRPFEKLSSSELIIRVRRARDDVKHHCAAKLNCPLKLQLEEVVRESERCCQKSATLSLESIARGKE